MRDVTAFDEAADREGFIISYPDASFRDWAVGCDCTRAEFEGVSDVRFIRELIDELSGRLRVDRGRVYVAGFSQGALMSQLLACRLSDRLAAVASVAATMLSGVAQGCSPSQPVSVLFVHGSEDTEFPPGGRVEASASTLSVAATIGTWVRLNSCGADPVVTPLPDTADDGTTVRLEKYTGCAEATSVAYYAVEGGGHSWPGSPADFSGAKSRDISATRVISDFFQGRRR
jgi:polyhydroxybutyrate depolymerase